jgi:hypothetical protein
MTPEERAQFEKTLADLALPLQQPTPDDVTPLAEPELVDMTMPTEMPDASETQIDLPEMPTVDAPAPLDDVNEAFRDGAGNLAVQLIPGNDEFAREFNEGIKNVEPDLDRHAAGQQSLPQIDEMMRDSERNFPTESETFHANITPPESNDEGRVHESTDLGTSAASEFERGLRTYLEANERTLRSMAETLSRHAALLNEIRDGHLREQT